MQKYNGNKFISKLFINYINNIDMNLSKFKYNSISLRSLNEVIIYNTTTYLIIHSLDMYNVHYCWL